MTVPIAALVAVLAIAAPAWASTVQIQDDAHVLNATAVQNDAATLPVGVYIWTTTQDAASKSTFDTDVRDKVSATFPIVIGINTQSRHESIQIGSHAGLSQNAALAAESSASSAFVTTIHSNQDYTAAVTAALDNLRAGFARAHRERPSVQSPVQRVPAHSTGSGAGLLLILLLIGAVVVVAVLVGRRRRSGSRMGAPSMVTGPSPMAPYPDYGPPYRSGMSPGAAGAIGAVGGGLLGYELGKMHGEEQQFHRDEMMYDRDRGDQDNSANQGDWVVGQDSDFGSAGGDQGSDTSGGGTGDW
jgi:uncharacterized membrane protein YgcG